MCPSSLQEILAKRGQQIPYYSYSTWNKSRGNSRITGWLKHCWAHFRVVKLYNFKLLMRVFEYIYCAIKLQFMTKNGLNRRGGCELKDESLLLFWQNPSTSNRCLSCTKTYITTILFSYHQNCCKVLNKDTFKCIKAKHHWHTDSLYHGFT